MFDDFFAANSLKELIQKLEELRDTNPDTIIHGKKEPHQPVFMSDRDIKQKQMLEFWMRREDKTYYEKRILSETGKYDLYRKCVLHLKMSEIAMDPIIVTRLLEISRQKRDAAFRAKQRAEVGLRKTISEIEEMEDISI